MQASCLSCDKTKEMQDGKTICSYLAGREFGKAIDSKTQTCSQYKNKFNINDILDSMMGGK